MGSHESFDRCGTDTHLLRVGPVGVGRGPFAQEALDEAGITVNKNTIPREPSSAIYPSGIRLGTPSVTTRGMTEVEMRVIGQLIVQVIDEIKTYHMPVVRAERAACLARFREEIAGNPRLAEVRQQVEELCAQFPLYPELVY
jgi:glycine/serine hydroxymethyltransferase